MKDEPIVWTVPDRSKIQCRDCVHRQKVLVNVGGEAVDVGTTRDTCEVYQGDGVWKPTDVLFRGGRCEFYLKESEL